MVLVLNTVEKYRNGSPNLKLPCHVTYILSHIFHTYQNTYLNKSLFKKLAQLTSQDFFLGGHIYRDPGEPNQTPNRSYRIKRKIAQARANDLGSLAAAAVSWLQGTLHMLVSHMMYVWNIKNLHFTIN